MRRGLKQIDSHARARQHEAAIKEFPDEEGTETSSQSEQPSVGLSSIKEFPDEEGTETPASPYPAFTLAPIKEFPDEEGTETDKWETRTLETGEPIKEFPDEEGTETASAAA